MPWVLLCLVSLGAMLTVALHGCATRAVETNCIIVYAPKCIIFNIGVSHGAWSWTLSSWAHADEGERAVGISRDRQSNISSHLLIMLLGCWWPWNGDMRWLIGMLDICSGERLSDWISVHGCINSQCRHGKSSWKPNHFTACGVERQHEFLKKKVRGKREVAGFCQLGAYRSSNFIHLTLLHFHFSRVSIFLFLLNTHTHTHTHTLSLSIYIYICDSDSWKFQE